jgi:hypothetical protein
MADDDDKKETTPPNPATEPPVNDAPPPAPPANDPPKEDNAVGELLSRVESLETQVSTLITGQTDSSPVKPPWTHRKWF